MKSWFWLLYFATILVFGTVVLHMNERVVRLERAWVRR